MEYWFYTSAVKLIVLENNHKSLYQHNYEFEL